MRDLINFWRIASTNFEKNVDGVYFRDDAVFDGNEHAYSCTSILFGTCARDIRNVKRCIQQKLTATNN